jgi:branched-chain amino acid aminotransferase
MLNILQHKDITVEKTKNPGEKNFENLIFGQSYTDHMFECDWEKGKGWEKPKIVPFHNFDMHPANSSLHYALQCFEG